MPPAALETVAAVKAPDGDPPRCQAAASPLVAPRWRGYGTCGMPHLKPPHREVLNVKPRVDVSIRAGSRTTQAASAEVSEHRSAGSTVLRKLRAG